MYIPDMSYGQSYLHPVWFVRYVGWLGKEVPSHGAVPPAIIDKLRYDSTHSYVDDGTLGCHACEICGKGEFHGEFVVHAGRSYFVLPVGVFHYIEEHGYCPPYRFMRAIAPPGTALEQPRLQMMEVVSQIRDFISSVFILPVLVARDCYHRRPKYFRQAVVGRRRQR